ncbi:glycoside hydrolase family 65 protein [Pediococcus ethanolidurans]|uniref:glycoside hydrolase family 65 protein n=1 Tax=Pediococcus ethanolidurans TaxID=319653 RepID=UPI001C1E9031|nr:glycoside hydrolase family 65 protein [Pediococcus ethanolidurans]MBU7554611.1 glycoside hydrolase family 65 protein [Pediococcus ethanolidurans]MBU7563359.1 glycoside hydrolase family 65 protein [Pediococcus ethanolidurans]MCV3315267.1 glycoside hydrolase family 65 protein [Pediococcus ethanolidurans]MCV3327527.1 glycoside hydrolase family 65 protein [Pediococcus ethanolidurans]
MLRTFEIDPWKIVTHKLDKQNKRLQESMTSIGNGYMGMRGMFEEDYSADTHSGIYIGGVWYPDKTVVGWWKNGYPKYFGKVINAVNFDKVNVWLNDKKVDLATTTIEDFELSLDMKNGILTRKFTVSEPDTKVRFTIQRFVSVAEKELFDVNYQIQNLGDQPVSVKLVSEINADVFNEDSNYDEKFWNVKTKAQTPDSGYLIAETKPNNYGTPQFTVGMEMTHKADLKALEEPVDDLKVANTFSGALDAKQTTNFEKRVIVVTSRDYDDDATLKAAMQNLSQQVTAVAYQKLVADQTDGWAKRWEKADVQVTGDDAAQQGIRFNLFQLFSTFYGEDKRLNIGPKGFTGEKYGGATYWDTEGFAIPLYLSLADKKVSENLLEYRYNQLAGAFHNAREQGLKGALYPMVTFNGIENHNEWEITFEEIHRNGTIAYAIYNYTRYTGDETYLKTKGIDVLTAISRFWADRVHWSQRQGVYMIHGVTGPNEYENNVNNNWYTNMLAQWTLKYTLESLNKVTPEKLDELAVSAEEKQHWQEIIDKMDLPEDKKLGIFVQNDCFLDKDLKPVTAIPKDQRPINQHWSWDKILRSPYIKQADVLQGIWYFIDRFPEDVKKRNFDFYEPLTVHESSLSASVHAILAADLHYEDKAVEMYERTARLDLDNYNNDTVDGLHITSMTGSWLAIVQGFAGMRVKDGTLSFKPFVPKKWTSYQFRINFRDRLIKVVVDKQETKISLLKGAPLTVELNHEALELKGGD